MHKESNVTSELIALIFLISVLNLEYGFRSTCTMSYSEINVYAFE